MNASVAPKRSQSNRNLAKLWLNVRMPLVAIIVLGTALGGGNVVWTNFQEAAQVAREEAFDQEVEGFFSAFSNPIAGYIKAADAAVANSDAIATLQSRDEAKYVQIEGAIRSAVNSAQGVRLVPIASPTRRRRYPPITFATLDLARESYRSGEQPRSKSFVREPQGASCSSASSGWPGRTVTRTRPHIFHARWN